MRMTLIKSLIVFVSIVCALIVVVVLVVVVMFLLKRRREMIYPASDDEKEPRTSTLSILLSHKLLILELSCLITEFLQRLLRIQNLLFQLADSASCCLVDFEHVDDIVEHFMT